MQATKSYKLTFQAGTGAEGGRLTGFVDADWAGEEGTRLSTSGFFFLVAGGAIAWSSGKQQSVALSSVESEYVAAAQCAAEGIWLARLAAEIGFKFSMPLPILTAMEQLIWLETQFRASVPGT